MSENEIVSVIDERRDVISVKGWLGTLLLLCIPVANIILLFVWAFGTGNENRRNYARAGLILAGIVILLYIIIFVLFVGLAISMS